jgi:hypothetical protein
MLRRSSLVECVSVLHGTVVYKVSIFFLFVNMYSHVCQKILSTHFIPYRARWRSHIIKPDKVLGHSTQKFFFCLLVLVSNMKSARPWMLAHLKIIWQFHTHPVHQKVSRFLGRDILGTTFFRAESSLIQSSCRSFIRVIGPYEISKVNFRVETKILVSMSEEI